jgi:hypothetical protein
MGSYWSRQRKISDPTDVLPKVQPSFLIDQHLEKYEEKIRIAQSHLQTAVISGNATNILRYKNFVLPHLYCQARRLIDQELVRLQEFILELKKKDITSDQVNDSLNLCDENLKLLEQKKALYSKEQVERIQSKILSLDKSAELIKTQAVNANHAALDNPDSLALK